MRFDFPFCGFCRLKFEKERERERVVKVGKINRGKFVIGMVVG